MVPSKRCLTLGNPKMMANAAAVADWKYLILPSDNSGSVKEMFYSIRKV
jgi:hypothetical protein